ncbi:hypothetical protein ABZ318_07195 [Streptomyces sp. NPDC006197]|uniref:hypothetical protein n=1 Tax=Streptomyces sp. NPDC006197 TaxID=3156685 RepID=UPI0033A1B42D
MHDSPFRSVHRKAGLASLCVATALAVSTLVAAPAFADADATPVAPTPVVVDHGDNNGWD